MDDSISVNEAAVGGSTSKVLSEYGD